MAHSITFTTAAARELRRLTPQVQDQIRPIIDALATEPRPLGVVKLEGGGDFYRVRSGNYRIVYQVDDTVLRVLIVTVGNRREVYRRR